MKKNKYIFIILLAVLVSFIWAQDGSATSLKAPDSAIKAAIGRLRTIAEMIYDDNSNNDNLDGYEGLCYQGGLNINQEEFDKEIRAIDTDVKDNNNNAPVICYNNEPNYCVQTFLGISRTGWCIDSTGYMGTDDYCDSLNYDCAYNEGENTVIHDANQILYEEYKIKYQAQKQKEYLIQIAVIIFILVLIVLFGYLIIKKKILKGKIGKFLRPSWGKVLLAIALLGISSFLFFGVVMYLFSDNFMSGLIVAIVLIISFIPLAIFTIAYDWLSFDWLSLSIGIILALLYYYTLACLFIYFYRRIKEIIQKRKMKKN